MDYDYHKAQVVKLGEITNLSAEKRESFFQQILIGSSSILGILVALHSGQTEHLYIRMVFVFAILILSLGILSTGIVLYDLSQLTERLRLIFQKEAEDALREDRRLNPVVVHKKKRTIFCEKYSLLLLIFSLFLLVVYTAITSFQ